jgi:hypothetical protein
MRTQGRQYRYLLLLYPVTCWSPLLFLLSRVLFDSCTCHVQVLSCHEICVNFRQKGMNILQRTNRPSWYGTCHYSKRWMDAVEIYGDNVLRARVGEGGVAQINNK